MAKPVLNGMAVCASLAVCAGNANAHVHITTTTPSSVVVHGQRWLPS
jgi:hypothetical protein